MDQSTTKPAAECAYTGCAHPVDDMDYCPGCKAHVCETHCSEVTRLGRHEPSDHWRQAPTLPKKRGPYGPGDDL